MVTPIFPGVSGAHRSGAPATVHATSAAPIDRPVWAWTAVAFAACPTGRPGLFKGQERSSGPDAATPVGAIGDGTACVDPCEKPVLKRLWQVVKQPGKGIGLHEGEALNIRHQRASPARGCSGTRGVPASRALAGYRASRTTPRSCPHPGHSIPRRWPVARR